jgi:uncharacterized protein YdaU (DUF1376 family)
MGVPYFPLYPTDFLADVGHLGNTELGIYWRLLLVYYRDQRALPAEPDRIRRVAMCFTPEENKTLEHVLLEFFVLGTDDEGRRSWRHKRADIEIDKARSKIKAMQDSAVRTNAMRWGSKGESLPESLPESPSDRLASRLAVNNQNQIQNQKKKESLPEQHLSKASSDVSTIGRSKAGSPVVYPPGFTAFWEAYPRKRGKDDAFKAWRVLKPTPALLEQMVAAIAVQRAGPEWTREGGQFIPHPATWLRAGRWKDEVETVADDGERLAAMIQSDPRFSTPT